MDKLKSVSESILLDEVAEARQVLENMINLQSKLPEEISIGILPFLSSLTDGIIKLLPSEEILESPRIKDMEFKKIVENVRVGYKQNSDKSLKKSANLVLNRSNYLYTELVKDYNIFQKLRIRISGQKDLGVFYFKGIPYANTNQYYLHLDTILDKTELKKTSCFSEDALLLYRKYSEYLACIINSFNIRDIIKNYDNSINYKDFKTRDYFVLDEKRRDFLNGILNFETQLLLFNILCQNNYILFILPLVLGSNKYFFTRSLLQSYLVSHTALIRIDNKHSDNFNTRQKSTLKDIIADKIIKLNIDNEFRNNIFHYNISGVPDSIFNSSDKFFEELIEFHSKKKFKDYQQLLIYELIRVNKFIEDLITNNTNGYELK